MVLNNVNLKKNPERKLITLNNERFTYFVEDGSGVTDWLLYPEDSDETGEDGAENLKKIRVRFLK